MPHELNETRMENRKNTREILFQRHEREVCIELSLTMKNGFMFRILYGENHWLIHQRRPQKKIDSVERQCSVFGGIRRVWYITTETAVFTRLDIFRLSFVFIDRTRIG